MVRSYGVLALPGELLLLMDAGRWGTHSQVFSYRKLRSAPWNGQVHTHALMDSAGESQWVTKQKDTNVDEKLTERRD